MKKMLLIACAALATPAVAQVPPPAAPAPHAGMGPAMHRMTSRADVAKHVDHMFAMLDANHDGVIDQSEMAQMGQRRMMGGEPGQMRQRPQRDRNAMFDRLDQNRDGSISRVEFARAPQMGTGMRHGGKGMMGGRGMQAMFAMADANHDGRVTRQEAMAAALRHFDMADTNHDGTISPDEQAAARAKMQAMHGQH